MSRVIDEKVVEMRFDNRDFEKNVSESMGTLDKLKKSLDFSDAQDSFSGLTQAANKVDFSSLSGALETVGNQFSAFEAIAVGALVNVGKRISDFAIDKFVDTVKGLTLDQLSAGFDKYANKTQSVQMIMNATGKSIEEVSDQLERLNWYTDETSYDFTEMVASIGKFTSAGVDLEEAVTSMEGIANWAGLSGATKQEANRAMYNLSQALAAGYVRLIDWKSIENANMATKEFKEMCIQAAEEIGTLESYTNLVTGEIEYAAVDAAGAVKASEISWKSFSEGLTKGQWLTTDVLNRVLSKYGAFTDRLSQVYNEINEAEGIEITTSQIIRLANDYKEGTLDMEQAMAMTGKTAEWLEEVLGELASSEYDLGRKAFAASQEAKTFREAIEATKDAVSTGWMNTFEILFGNYEEAKVLWTELSNELWDIFAGPISRMNDMLMAWKNIGGRDDLIQGLKNIYHAVRSITDPIAEAWTNIFPPVDFKGLYDFTDKFEKFTSSLILGEEKIEALREVFEGLFGVIKLFANIANDVFGKFFGGAFSGLGDYYSKLLDIFQNIGNKLSTITTRFQVIQDVIDKYRGNNAVFQNILDGFQETSPVLFHLAEIIGMVSDSAEIAGNFLGDMFSLSDRIVNYREAGGGLPGVVNAIAGDLEKAARAVTDLVHIWTGSDLEGLFESFKGTLDDIVTEFEILRFRGVFDEIEWKLDKLKNTFKTTFGGIEEYVGPIISSLTSIWNDFIEGLGMFTGFDVTSIDSFFDSLSRGIDILDEFIRKNKILSEVVSGFKDSIRIVANFLADFLSLSGTIRTFEEAGGGFAGVLAIISDKLSAIGGVLNTLFKRITGFDLKAISNTVLAVISLISEAFLALADKIARAFGWKDNPFGKMLENSAGALKIFQEKLDEFGIHFDASGITGIFSGIGKAMGGLWSVVQKVAPGLADGIKLILGMIKSFAEYVTTHGSFENLLDLTKIGSIIYLSKKMGEVLKSVSEAISAFSAKLKAQALSTIVLSISASMIVLAGAAFIISKIDSDKVGVVLGTLGVALAGLIGAMVASKFANPKAMREIPKTILSIAAGLIILAKAVDVMSGPIEKFANMKWGELGKGFLGLAGSLGGLFTVMKLLPENSLLIGKGVKSLATSVLILVGALELLRLVDWNTILSSLGKVAAMVVSMEALLGVGTFFSGLANLLSGKNGLSKSSFKEIGDGLLSLSKALIIFAAALWVFDKIDLSTLGGGLLKLSGAILALTVVSLAFNAFTPALEKFGKTLDIFAGVVKKFAVTFAILAVIGLAAKIFGESAYEIVQAAIDLLDAGLKMLAEKSGSIAESIVVIILGILHAVADHAEEITDVVMDIVTKVLTRIGQKLKEVNFDEFIDGAGFMAGLLAAIFLIKKAKIGQGDILKTELIIVELGAMLATMFGIFAGIGWLSDKLGMKKLIDDFGEIATAVADILLGKVGILVAACAGILLLLSKFKISTETLTATGGAFGSIILLISEITGILDAVGVLFAASGGFFYGIDALVGWIRSWDPKKDFEMDNYTVHAIERFGEVVIAIADVLGGIVGHLVGGVAGGIAGETVEQVFKGYTDGISYLAEHGKEFFETMNGIDLSGASELGDMILSLTSASILDGLTAFADKKTSFKEFGEGLKELGPGLNNFIGNVKEIDEDGMTKAAKAAEVVMSFANVTPPSGGFWQLLSGEKNLATFGSQLSTFGIHLKDFSQKAKDVKMSDLELMASAADVVIAFAKEVPKTEGVVTKWIWGDNDLKTFGEDLYSFTVNLVKASKDGKYIDYDVINAIKYAVTQFAYAAKAVKDVKTTSSLYTKAMDSIDNTTNASTLDSFATMLAKFGDQFKKFYDKIKDVDSDKLRGIVGAIKETVDSLAFADAATLSQKIQDTTDKLLDAVSTMFTKETSKVKTGKAAEKLIEYIADKFVEDSTIAKISNKITDMITKAFGEDELREGLKQAGLGLIGEIQNGMTEAFESEGGLSDSFINYIQTLSTAIATDGQKGTKYQWYSAGAALISAFGNGLIYEGSTEGGGSSPATQVKNKLYEFIGSLARIITSEETKKTFTQAGATLIGYVATGFSDAQTVQQATQAGNYVVDGFANSMSSTESINKVKKAAKAVTDAATGTAKKELEISSPSEVWYGIGQWVLKGLENSIFDGIPGVVDKVKELVSAMSDGFDGTKLIDKVKSLGFSLTDIFGGGADLYESSGKLSDLVSQLGDSFKESFNNFQLSGSIGDFVNEIRSNFNVSFKDYLNSGEIEGFGNDWLSGLTNPLDTWLESGSASDIGWNIGDTWGEGLVDFSTSGALGEAAETFSDEWFNSIENVGDEFYDTGYSGGSESGQGMLDGLVDTLTDGLGSIEIDGPTIKPVVDMSEVSDLMHFTTAYGEFDLHTNGEIEAFMTPVIDGIGYALQSVDQAALVYQMMAEGREWEAIQYAQSIVERSQLDAQKNFEILAGYATQTAAESAIAREQSQQLAMEEHEFEVERYASLENSIGETNAELVGLREDVGLMSDKLGRLQIVMDSGTLVGEIVDEVDAQIGRKTVLVGRGI